MCLDTITKRYKTPTKSRTRAWKVFVKRGNELCFEYATDRNGSSFVPQGQWLRARRSHSSNLSQAYSYTPGFHCFATEKAAYEHMTSGQTVVKVTVRGITTKGNKNAGWSDKDNFNVLVAREMYVPLPKKSKEKK